MATGSLCQMVRYKRWARRGIHLYDIIKGYNITGGNLVVYVVYFHQQIHSSVFYKIMQRAKNIAVL